jgi:hypothetical protein
MTFADVKAAADDLRRVLRDSTGQDLVASVSVDEPLYPADELHFTKLVSWSYVFLFEASQPAAGHVLSIVRNASPSEHTLASNVRQSVNYLRTAQVHNLRTGNPSDEFKLRQARIWLAQNGGTPPDWTQCNAALSDQVEAGISQVRDLLAVVARYWPAHAFDGILVDAASSLGLRGFDHVAYRQTRLEKWRELANFFEDRSDAELALGMAIRSELEHLFGSARLVSQTRP